jgi:hypothetical protein
MGYNGHCADSDGDTTATMPANAATMNQRFTLASFLDLMTAVRDLSPQTALTGQRVMQKRIASLVIVMFLRRDVKGYRGRYFRSERRQRIEQFSELGGFRTFCLHRPSNQSS